MLKALFIIQSETGTLLYEKILIQEINDESTEIFSNFLNAIKQFSSQMVFDGPKELKSISLGDYYVKISHIAEIKSDLALLIDKDDEKSSMKLMRPIIEFIIENKQIFLEPTCSPELFRSFDEQMNHLILSAKIIDSKLVKKNENKIFKSIWAQKGSISENLRYNLLKQKEDLLNHIKNQQNLINKSILFQNLIEVVEKQADKSDLIKFQKEAELLNNEIKDIKLRLKYYLQNTKNALKEKDYKTAYSNLYSFSNKLQHVSKSLVQKKYYNYADILMNKESVPKIEFSQIVSEILMMPENVEEYFA